MHWLARVFASAIARRIAYLLVALLLAWCGIDHAQAQTYRCQSSAQPRECSQGEAYQEAWKYARDQAARANVGQTRPDRYQACVDTAATSYAGYFTGNASCGGGHQGIRSFYYGTKCAQEPSYTGTGPWSSVGGNARSGSLGCRGGCDGQWDRNTDGTSTWTPLGNVCPDDQEKNCQLMGGGNYWNPILKVCEPPQEQCAGGKPANSLGQCGPEPCPAGMIIQPDGTCKKKENECPAGNVRSPDGKCLPGDGQCAQGEVRGPDGTCKKDRDEDGEPDPPGEGEPNSFSGGDDCNSPPSCSGDAIMCGQARIQWRIDCNTRRNTNIAGGSCSAMPVCTGEKCDAMEHTQMIMQWRTACAVEKLAQGTGGGGDGNGDLAAIRDALTGTGGTVDPGASQPGSGAWMPDTPDGGGGVGQPDTSGYGWGGGSCPTPPAIEVMGSVIEFNVQPLCNWLSLASYFVMGLAALGSLRIVATRDA